MFDSSLRDAHALYYLASHGLTSATGLRYRFYEERGREIEFRNIHAQLRDPACGRMLDEIDKSKEAPMDHAYYAYYSVSHGKMHLDVVHGLFEKHPGSEADFRALHEMHDHPACGQMLAEIASIRAMEAVERCIGRQ